MDQKQIRKRRRKEKLNEADNFGADENDPNRLSETDEESRIRLKGLKTYSQFGQSQDSDTKKQLAMLEEVAQQLREEKE